jgi:hypothetical protein
MKKWIFIAAGALLIIIVLFVVGLSNLGPLVKKAVNTYGPKMTKTDVHVADVGVSIFSGQAKLKDFYLGNPDGFKSPHAVKVASVYVNVDEGSITSETIVVDEITVVNPEITYEKSVSGDNFKTILNNVDKATRAGESSKKPSATEDGKGKKLLIRTFIVRGGVVNLALPMLPGKNVGAPLPDIHVKNVGQKKEGVTPARAFEEILAVLYRQITSPVVIAALNERLRVVAPGMELLGSDAKGGLEAFGEKAKEKLEDVTDKVKGLFGK